MSYAGPIVMLGQFLTWVLGLWIGFALVYVSDLNSLHSGGEISFDPTTFVDALYLSGVTLTTVGFGDLVAETDALRLVTVAEAAGGLAVITAAITYLLSVYPLISQVRVAARSVPHAEADDEAAARLVVFRGPETIAALQRDLIQVDEDTQRFPVLYYFHSDDPSASISALVRGACLVTMQLRWGVAEESLPHGRWYGEQLTAPLDRLMNHYRRRFMGRPGSQGRTPGLTEDQLRHRLGELRRAAATVAQPARDSDRDLAAFGTFVTRSNAFLSDLGRRHAYPERPL